jgi:hypothetical protein
MRVSYARESTFGILDLLTICYGSKHPIDQKNSLPGLKETGQDSFMSCTIRSDDNFAAVIHPVYHAET